MILYEDWYRKYGIRKATQLALPPMTPMARLIFPRLSLIHYTDTNVLTHSINPNDIIFESVKRPIILGHVVETAETKGTPRRLGVSPISTIQQFHSKNKRFRLMHDIKSADRDMNGLLVYDYGYMDLLYRYPRSIYSEYYKWWNKMATVMKEITTLAPQTQRQHYIFTKLPTVLPSLNNLKLGSPGVALSQKFVQVFKSPESLFLLELWKWFGPDRAHSVFARIPDNTLKVVNIVFQESGKWFVMNLGKMNSWRCATKEELLEDKEHNTKGLDAIQIQRQTYRMIMAFYQIRSDASPDMQDVVESELKDASEADKDGEASSPAVNHLGELISGDEGSEHPNEQLVDTEHPANQPNLDQVKSSIGVKAQGTVTITDHSDSDDNEPDTRPEDLTHPPELDSQLDKDFAELDKISELHLGLVSGSRIMKYSDNPHETVVEDEFVEYKIPERDDSLEGGVKQVADKLAANGMLTSAEYKRYHTIASTYKSIISPDGTTLDKFIQVKPEDVKIDVVPSIPDSKVILDKTMLKSSLHVFDSQYVKHVLQKDIAAMSLNVQKAGIAVTDYQVETVEDIQGSFNSYLMRVVPVEGAASTLKFKLPVLEEDGSYLSNGVRYRLRKQKVDLPIRKIGPNNIALTSYYGKTFVSRSEKKVNDYGHWIRNRIMEMGLDNKDTTIVNLHPSDVFDNEFQAPRLHSILAMSFRTFTLNTATADNPDLRFSFNVSMDHRKREETFGKEALSKYERDGAIIIGMTNDSTYLVIGNDNLLYYSDATNSLRVLGSIEHVLKLEPLKAPVDYALILIMGHHIPIAIILGYEIGLGALMALLGVKPRRVNAGARLNLKEDEYSLVFSDETLIFSKHDALATMILAGFNEYHKAIRNYSVYEFDKRDVYLNVVETAGVTVRYLREIDLMYNMFIDPITKDLLTELKEPTEFRGLLLRACEMLLVDQHPDELDSRYMRIRGNERLAGAVYTELVRSIRAHNGRFGKSKHPIDLNPYAVWKVVAQDPSLSLVEEINPVQNLKETEEVTYSGVGGRNNRSMTKKTRLYHKHDMGVVSEGTVDSSDVGINTYTSADPQFTSLRGIAKPYVIGKTGATALLSSSALLAPGSDCDDPKRVNFINIQMRHITACDQYQPAQVRTGYDSVMAHRTSDLFATTAKQNGTVLSIDEKGVVVQYEDGTKKGYELGRRFGAAAGLTIPHNLVSDLKPNQKFKVGDVISHNEGFFKKDFLSPGSVVWKNGIMVKTVLMESTQTLEDSSAISQRVADKLNTRTTKIKNIVVGFDQEVHKLIKSGELVESESILCVIEDALTARSALFDQESLDTLRVLGSPTPQAKTKGVIERIEVYYHGDKEDMSQSLRTIANQSDKEMGARLKSSGKKIFTGAIDSNFRVEGDPLLLDTACIRIYITSDVSMGVGD